MGDGNIEWNPEKEKLTLAELHSLEKHEDYYDTPRSTDGVECSTPTSPNTVVLEELHRNTNQSVNTPDLSNASIGNPTVDRPPAGEAQISPRRNGRRNFRQDSTSADNAYGLPLGPAAGLGRQESGQSAADGIFSVRGTRSVKINRHRDNVTVFPSGCMGVTDDEEAATPVKDVEAEGVAAEDDVVVEESAQHSEVASPSYHSEVVNSAVKSPPSYHSEVVNSTVKSPPSYHSEVSNPAVQTPAGKSSVVKSPAVKSHSVQSPTRDAYKSSQPPTPDTVKPVTYTSSRGSFRPNSAARNPLTGEGYTDKDIRRHFVVKKPDGNPLLGQGYDEDAKSSRPKHVPPGGYSKGLW